MSSTRLLLRWAALAACLSLNSCTPWREPDWREVPVGSRPFEDAWQAVVRAAESDDFAVDEAVTDRGERILISRWRERAMPFRGSVRRRLHAEFEEREEQGWVIRYYVERQKIADMAAGFEPENDDWEDDGQDSDYERIMAHKLRLTFADWPAANGGRR